MFILGMLFIMEIKALAFGECCRTQNKLNIPIQSFAFFVSGSTHRKPINGCVAIKLCFAVTPLIKFEFPFLFPSLSRVPITEIQDLFAAALHHTSSRASLMRIGIGKAER